MPEKGLPLHSLSLDPAIDSQFLSVGADTPLIEVLALMSRVRSSCVLPTENLQSPQLNHHESETIEASKCNGDCVLVMQGSQLLGVFTERDIVRMTAAGISLGEVEISDIVTYPPTTLKHSQAQDIFTALSLFRQHRIRHLPILDDQGRPLGVVTHESIRKSLQPVNLLTRLRYVEDVMTTQVIHAPTTASVLKLAQLMTDHQVSCIVITQEEPGNQGTTDSALSTQHSLSNPTSPIPVGIVTERDIVQFQALELDLQRTPAATVMSTPLFCLQPSNPLWQAHEEMHRRHVRRLVVAGSQGELIGIVSQTSLLQVLNPADMYDVIEVLQQAVEERTSEIEATNECLRHEILERQRAELALLQAHDELKQQVEERTAQLRAANAQLHQDLLERQQVEAALRGSESKLRQKASQLEQALHELHSYQMQLIQTEKMSSLGQLVAGVAHEINNPINFIYGNLAYAREYVQDIMQLLKLYAQHYPQPVREVQQAAEKIDLDFVKTDLPKLLSSMKGGADRIRDLVLSLRNFSRLDEAEMKSVNLHEGLESTLLIVQNQLKGRSDRPEIQIVKEYGELPLVECYAGQLNQVFMHLLSNAIDALDESVAMSQLSIVKGKTTHKRQRTTDKQQTIRISTNVSTDGLSILIRVADNGSGMTETVHRRLFDPFFTTKTVGKGTGLGLSISYQIIVEKHGGQIQCVSAPGEGTEFVVEIPIRQQQQVARFAIA
ncbi:MAG: CBS domain-containing protein [Kastovskya adunca ATA6-11-RM4]|jgi:signal transduction histidine kinase|nr:CBS domain-containing protein [Kastovskya adunca ATA6-11-RM4]